MVDCGPGAGLCRRCKRSSPSKNDSRRALDGGTVSLEAAHELHTRVLGAVLVDSINDVDNRRSVAAAEADAERLRSNFRSYFSDLSGIFTNTSNPAIRHWVEEQAMNADPNTAIGPKLDTPNIDPQKLFANAGVPIRGIDAEPPLSEKTNFVENRRYADYDAILVSDSGHFIPLERPEEFNRDLSRWLLQWHDGRAFFHRCS